MRELALDRKPHDWSEEEGPPSARPILLTAMETWGRPLYSRVCNKARVVILNSPRHNSSHSKPVTVAELPEIHLDSVPLLARQRDPGIGME